MPLEFTTSVQAQTSQGVVSVPKLFVVVKCKNLGLRTIIQFDAHESKAAEAAGGSRVFPQVILDPAGDREFPSNKEHVMTNAQYNSQLGANPTLSITNAIHNLAKNLLQEYSGGTVDIVGY